MQPKDKSLLITSGVVLAGAFVGYHFIVAPILEAVGLKKSADDIKNDQFNTADVWSASWYKNLPAGAYLMKQAEVNDLINRLWDATGFFNDDEAAIYSAMRQPRYKSQVAQLNAEFLKAKGKSLIDYLSDYLSESELTKVREIVNQKPRGY